ncbi:tripartite tricarboxylate transporter substrate binding protein [Variovorax sp. J31P207]|uniref:Bug family tripartite tricarboxylate transporter substrate binding protein n=1 Tax=Variovorax sp. J31P207 TaxID=3053510 RepID=UPI0025783635|nr:tripartite tricarboxylate transporter substrate binding protein [Variovorax sp. J31P207]MDM0066971.1 tripartite tricarboxylate transporter substrate binding protein [Variovorax sp. J31P207]
MLSCIERQSSWTGPRVLHKFTHRIRAHREPLADDPLLLLTTMTPSTRRSCLIRLLSSVLGMSVFTPCAFAENWPRQPVKMILPVGAGSVPDAMARLVADKLTQQLGKPVVIENRPGAGGIVGVQAMEMAPRDDHTVMFMFTGVSVITPLMVKSVRYDVLRDFTPIAGLAETSFMLAASPGVPAKTLPEIIRYSKERPGSVVLGHVGPGSTGHMMAENFARRSQGGFSVVGFSPSSGPIALMSGDASYYIDGIAALLPLVKAGKVTPVAVFSSSPLPGLEGYKLANETVPGTEGMGSFGMMGPKNMSTEALAAMIGALGKVMSDPDVIARLRELAIFPTFTPGPAYADVIRRENAAWSLVARTTGMEPQ